MKFLSYSKWVLPCGARVIFRRMDSPLVAVNLWVRAGVRNEAPEKNGISHFFEHMVFKGTVHYPGLLLSRRVQALGGTLNAGTSLDTTDFYLVVPREFWKEALSLEMELVTQPLFDPEDIEREKMVVIQEIHIDEDDPEERLAHILYERVFSETPYGFPILGREETVRQFTREDLLEYRDRFYHPANMVLAVSGNLKDGELFAFVEDLFAPFAPPEEFDTPFFPPLPIPERQIVECVMDVRRFYGAIGFLCGGIKSDDFYLLRLLSLVMGDGLGSRLNIALREERRIVDTIHTTYSYYEHAGIFAIFFTFSQGNFEEIEEAIQGEFAKLTYFAPTEEELERAKNLLKSGFFNAIETTLGSAELLGRLDTIDSIDRSLRALFQVERVRAHDLVEVARRYVDFERGTSVCIKPGG
ncbi:M16 family metallopeptidase [Candidatus Caldatribacterium sp.]|uniref:M16 family metallopeptidase n=1 Tax=Candidatus Caldatribacterium sp. TaxID=2282143 RepID=UPI002994C767|nr:insulinase family protein [Candidatus Caldatribacterium sp.]MDW8081793.1 pitrilysin family protein [Candidatus Calescibacterium sp.]